MFDKHNYNASPFCPLGCAAEMHVMPKNRKTWEEHTKTAHYIGKPPEMLTFRIVTSLWRVTPFVKNKRNNDVRDAIAGYGKGFGERP